MPIHFKSCIHYFIEWNLWPFLWKAATRWPKYIFLSFSLTMSWIGPILIATCTYSIDLWRGGRNIWAQKSVLNQLIAWSRIKDASEVLWNSWKVVELKLSNCNDRGWKYTVCSRGIEIQTCFWKLQATWSICTQSRFSLLHEDRIILHNENCWMKLLKWISPQMYKTGNCPKLK